MPTQAALPQQFLERFFGHGHLRTFEVGDIIISAGDFSSELYYLVSGSVSVQYEDAEGHEIVLAYLHEGEFFGEIGMFDERHERSAWVRARSPCEVAHLSYDALQRIGRESPSLIFELLSQMALRVRNTSRKASALAFTDVAGRVARVLLDLREQPDVVHHPQGIKLTITRHELGRLAGCSREMVSRVLHVLEERRVVGFEGRSIILYDRTPPA